MLVLAIVIGLLGLAVLVSWGMPRGRDDDALLRHERALAALRELNARPMIAGPPVTHPDATGNLDCVRILGPQPDGVPRTRRRTRAHATAAARRAAQQRRNRPDPSARPTIASLPRRLDDHGSADAPAEFRLYAVGSTAPLPAAAPDHAEREPAHDVAPNVADAAARKPTLAPVPAPDGDRRARPARALAVAGAIVLLGGAAVAATLGIEGHQGPAAAHATRATTAPRHAGAAHRSRAHATRPLARTTPATIAPAVQVAANGDATVVATAPFAVALNASGDCWVRADDGSGHTLFTGTMHAGQVQTFVVTSPVAVQLGDSPYASVTVNGHPLDLAGLGRTATIRFTPA